MRTFIETYFEPTEVIDESEALSSPPFLEKEIRDVNSVRSKIQELQEMQSLLRENEEKLKNAINVAQNRANGPKRPLLCRVIIAARKDNEQAAAKNSY